ncbi:MAG: hypothetical protein WDM90_00915 [Ferruginibacter sp.]
MLVTIDAAIAANLSWGAMAILNSLLNNKDESVESENYYDYKKISNNSVDSMINDNKINLEV